MNAEVVRQRRLLMVVVPAALIAAGLVAWSLGGRTVSTDNAYAKALTVDITPEVTGQAVSVPVKANQRVAKGDLLFAVDPGNYEIAVRTAQAEVYLQMAHVESLRSEIREALAKKKKAQTDADYYTREVQRLENLREKSAVSQSQLDDMRHKRDAAVDEVAALEQDYRRIGIALNYDLSLPTEKHPFYTAAVAQLDKAKLDLARTRVVAPMDGVITNKSVNQGDLVSPGRPVMTLVQADGLWVDANLKETELTHVRVGQPVEVHFDVYPGVTYAGSVESIAPATGSEFALLPPQNASGNWVKVVQRIPVRIHVDVQPGQPPLRAGLSAEVDIDTGVRRIQRWFH